MAAILIVDDERSIRVTLAEFLREAGYEAHTAEDADTALSLFGQRSFDVVITDIILPRITGVDLLKRLRAQAEDVQVIMMTGEPTVETAVEAVRGGAQNYLTKPVGKHAAQLAVAQAMRVRTLLAEKRRLEAANRRHQENLEQEVAQRTAALREALAESQRRADQLRKLSRAVEQSPVSILITDATGAIEFVNPKVTQTTGYAAAELLGQNPRLLKSGETPPHEYQKLWAAITAGQEWRGEFHNKRKDGSLYWERASISPIRDAAGTITHFIAVKEDITETKQLETKFLRAQRLESIGTLASGIAHDLNNVLAPIIMAGPMIRAEVTSPQGHHLLDGVENSATRGADIVRQLLTFGRGGLQTRRLVLPGQHLEEMRKIIGETFPKNIRCDIQVPPDLWPLIGDPTQLHQALLNLCVNARDAMPNGGQLRLNAENLRLDEAFVQMCPGAKAGPHVVVSVADTGGGIPANLLDKIFDPFFTTKEVGKGTGLGLATVQQILRNHGGFVQVRSEPGAGAEFRLFFPAHLESAAPARVADDETLVPGRGELILVVDDEPNVRDVIRRLLEKYNYGVLLAKDGTEAIAQFAVHRGTVGLVLTDLLMPVLDGVATARSLRSLDPDLNLVLMTGWADPAKPPALDGVNGVAVLRKPFTAAALLRVLSETLKPA